MSVYSIHGIIVEQNLSAHSWYHCGSSSMSIYMMSLLINIYERILEIIFDQYLWAYISSANSNHYSPTQMDDFRVPPFQETLMPHINLWDHDWGYPYWKITIFSGQINLHISYQLNQCGGFLTLGLALVIIQFGLGLSHHKPSILGYHHDLWKPPNITNS